MKAMRMTYGATEKTSGGFYDRNSAKTRSIGFEWEKSPSLEKTVTPVIVVVEYDEDICGKEIFQMARGRDSGVTP